MTASASPLPGRADVTGIVLAGGLGRRMGGVDKGLVEFDGAPLVARVIARLAPQVATLVVNANRNATRYAAFGYPVVPDAIEGYAGPLAGLHAGMRAAETAYVVTAPCDSPWLPADLVARLAAAMAAGQAQVAVARTAGRAHPVFTLGRRDLVSHLESFLAAGGRKIDAWYATLAVAEAVFDDEAEAFSNFNTREELAAGAKSPPPIPGANR